jgi:EAL domain-containing protein (putative c-di-GMP-specific phosphodiesterase class I)
VQRQELKLYYQPQFEIERNRIVGVEALLRWEHPELGVIAPTHFIPIAEESGLIVPIGNWVLQEACRQNQRWQEAGYGPFKIAVNVSALQLKSTNFVESVAEALEQSGLEARWLELELTESVVMGQAEETALQLARLRQLGVSITIDDFGTGYSSLSYLQQLPITTIKIDRSFITRLGEDALILSSNGAIVRAIITLAHSLSLEVVAEGVETPEQLSFLRNLGCDMVQGYLFMRPVSLEEFLARLEKYPNRR